MQVIGPPDVERIEIPVSGQSADTIECSTTSLQVEAIATFVGRAGDGYRPDAGHIVVVNVPVPVGFTAKIPSAAQERNVQVAQMGGSDVVTDLQLDIRTGWPADDGTVERYFLPGARANSVAQA